MMKQHPHAILLWGIVCAGVCLADFPKSKAWIHGTSYIGPGDVISGAKAFWGLRGYATSFSGAVANMCDVATGAVCADATWSNGVLTLPLIGGVACDNGSAKCQVKTLYDQTAGNNCNSASCDMAQAAAANRPILVVPGVSNGCPTDTDYCISFTRASSQCLFTANTYTASQPIGFSAVAIRTGSTTLGNFILTSSAQVVRVGFANAVNQLFITAGTQQNLTSIADSSWHGIQGVFSNSVGAFAADGSTTTANNGTNTPSASLVIGSGNAACSLNNLDGKVREIGIWNSDITANFSALNSNAHAYPSAW